MAKVLKVTNHAYDKYNQATPTGQAIKAVPRHKFTFTASLNYLGTDGGLRTLPLDKIVNIQMPSWTSSSITMNSYNRKRIVQTNYEYSPITMIAYDIHSPSVLQNFLKDYSNYYFAGPMNESYTDFLTSDKGFKLQSQRNYIKTLDILRQDGQSKNKITVYNPIITGIDADTLDYSDSSLVQYRLSFVYEGYDIKDIG
jgi:hypothetical protein